MYFSYPLEGELENSTGYLATLPLEQYGASVTLTEPTELSEVTDNYALAAIKVTYKPDSTDKYISVSTIITTNMKTTFTSVKAICAQIF